ncbi:MAG: aminomethyl-transferring glycine dehydrogenase subunit GcvPB, partial [Phycisphaerae bacterium]
AKVRLPKDQDQPLLFEMGSPGACAAAIADSDVPAVDRSKAIGSEFLADDGPDLPQIGELDLVRHYTRLAHRVFSVDENFYPLGSCTMKYNPRVNEKAAAMPGFAALHPCQNEADVQGMLELLFAVRSFLEEIAGLAEVTLQPSAGAQGEMTGLMIISAYHRSRGQPRPKVLTPDSAHGTNPASCTMCGNKACTVKSKSDGRVDLDDLRSQVDDQTAALMLTNPNTVGVFDEQIADIADILKSKGAQLYLDGANMNALLGIARPGDFGVDVMHFNTHKTFSTPHGSGGPGSGPVGVAEHLQPFLPVPQVVRRDDGTFGWDYDRPHSIGKVRSFYGQSGVLVRAYAYIRSLGADGLLNVSRKAVLAANYLAARLKDHYHMPFPPPYAHEFVMVPELGRKARRERKGRRDEGTKGRRNRTATVRERPWGERQSSIVNRQSSIVNPQSPIVNPQSAGPEGRSEECEVTEIDIAKRLIDYGFHPPTMSWPIQHCLMIEPTETESLATLDAFADALLAIAEEIESDPESVRSAPHTTPVGRMDEVTASRKPNVRWKPPTYS